MYKKILILTCFYLINYTNANESSEYQTLIINWETQEEGSKAFVLKDKSGKIIETGTLKWNLKTNTWSFIYKKHTITIENNQIVKTQYNTKRTYPCTGFAKILTKPIKKWHEIMDFDSEIRIDGKTYTSFKTNKDYIVFCFKTAPFKLLSITFSENNETYILSFEEN